MLQYVTERWRLGVLRPDTGLKEPDVSSSSADDQDVKSWQRIQNDGNKNELDV